MLVLLLACTNVAGLLIARGSTRRQEMAVRASIGAERGHLVRQLLTESVLIALLGGVEGVLLALGGLRFFAGASSLPLSAGDLVPSPLVLSVTLVMTLGSGMFFGILPAGSGSRPNVMRVLRDTMHGATEGAARHRLRATLVVVQVALAMVLLAGAGLMVNSFLRLTLVDPGFDAERLISFQVPLSRSFYGPAKTAPFDVELGSRVDSTRETSVVLTLFGAVAVLLALLGVYGIVSQMLGQRRREIGIRIALGAQTPAVLGLVMRQGVVLVFAGTGLGLIASLALTRALGSMLWSVSPTDPLTYALVLVTVLVVGAVACLLPARRASRIDPLLVIRD